MISKSLSAKNVNNQLVFDFGGSQQHTFTFQGEIHQFIINNLLYNVTFHGYNNGLSFSIENKIPNIRDFNTFITTSAHGISANNTDTNIEIGLNVVSPLSGVSVTCDMLGVKLEIDQAYDNSIIAIIYKDYDLITYFKIDTNQPNVFDDRYIIDFLPDQSIFSNNDQKILKNTISPSINSRNGVEIVSLSGNHVGISFTPENNLTGILIDVNIMGSQFRIDSAYDGETLIINERRNIGNKATSFMFLSSLNFGINTYRINNFIDNEFLRLRLNGYF
jgi:hypothetical protein